MIHGRRIITAAAVSATVFTLVSCSPAGPPSQKTEALGEAAYALCFSAQSRDMDGKSQDGKVLLVNDDGAFSEVQTWGMDMCSMAWTEKGLFFSDMKTDYLLDGNGMKSFENAKTDSQYAMLATTPDTAVGLYNLGFSDVGYTTQVVTTTSSGSSLAEVEGSYFIAAQCEGEVFGIGLATGPYSKTGDPDTEPMVLSQLTGTNDGKEKVVGSSTQAREGAVLNDAPCLNGKIYYISDERRGGLDVAAKPVLSIWDTKTGKYESKALSSDEVTEPFISEDGTGFPYVTRQSLKDGKLEWYGVKDSIMSTDIKTGHTERKFSVEGYSDNSASSEAIFTDTEVVVMADNNDGSPYRILRYDRSTGEEVGQVVLDDDPAKISSGLFFRGFAVRP